MESVGFALTVPVPADEVLRTYAEVMGANTDLTLTQPAPGILLIEDRWTPWWLYIPMILAFPLGLLLLLVKNTARVTVTARQTDGGTDIDVAGRASKQVSEGLHGVADLLDEVGRAGSPAT